MRNFALFGNPVSQTLSPLMHNAALEAMGIAGRYEAIRVDDLEEAVRSVRDGRRDGASVTIPFKESVIGLLDTLDGEAEEIGAVNTIVRRDGRLAGFNTDWKALLLALAEVMDLGGKRFAVLGTGGTARSVLYAVRRGGGKAALFGRTPEKVLELAGRWGCPGYALADLAAVRADVVVNTTPVGMSPGADESPLDGRVFRECGAGWAVDVIYRPRRTRFLRDAEAAGCRTLGGAEMFVRQGAEQIRLWTGAEPPVERMREVVLRRLREEESSLPLENGFDPLNIC